MTREQAIFAIVGFCGAIFASNACFFPAYETTSSTTGATGGHGGEGGMASSSTGGAGGTGGGTGGMGCPQLPPAETIACDQGNPSGIAVDATMVYWTNSDTGEIASYNKLTGEIVVLFTGETQPCAIAVAGANLVWRTQDGVRRASVGGGSPSTLAMGQGNSCAIGIDSTHAYWFAIAAGNNSVLARSLFTGSPEPIANGTMNSSQPGALDAAYADGVYWTDLVAQKVTYSPKMMPFGNNDFASVGSFNGIATDESYYFFTDSMAGTVRRGQHQASADAGSIASGQADPGPIAAINQRVYWINRATTQLMSASRNLGSVATELASDTGAILSLAVDATHVYYTVPGSGRVMRVTHN